MAANADPAFTRIGKINGVLVTAANTSSQGGGTVGTDIFLAFTADATNGSFVREARWMLTETTIATASTATVGRVWASSVTSGSTTSSNTHLLQEVALASQTPSSTLAGVPIIIPLGFWLPAGWTILASNHAAPAANTAWKLVVIGGDY